MMQLNKAQRRRIRVKARKADDLKSAPDKGWNKHTEYHWWRSHKGLKLDWWPSTRKAQYNGVLYKGIININEFMEGL